LQVDRVYKKKINIQSVYFHHDAVQTAVLLDFIGGKVDSNAKMNK